MVEHELYHYGVKGMKWGVRRNLRKSTDFQDSKKNVKRYHKKYMESEGAYYNAKKKAEAQFDAKRPYNPNMSKEQHLEWNIDRYVHVLNKSNSSAKNRDRAKQEYKQLLQDTVDKHRNTLVGDIKITERQRQRIDRIIRDELVKDLFKD